MSFCGSGKNIDHLKDGINRLFPALQDRTRKSTIPFFPGIPTTWEGRFLLALTMNISNQSLLQDKQGSAKATEK